jgi:hypothetical protein
MTEKSQLVDQNKMGGKNMVKKNLSSEQYIHEWIPPLLGPKQTERAILQKVKASRMRGRGLRKKCRWKSQFHLRGYAANAYPQSFI